MTRRGAVFVTGTDTGIGKTRAAVTLLMTGCRQKIRVAGMKPVASGCVVTTAGLRNEDALLLQQHSNIHLPYEWVNPYAFLPPIAPHVAAAQASRTIEMAPIETAFKTICEQADRVVVEGVGGWRVPLGNGLTLSAIPARLELAVLLVVGLRLGCISHALLSAEAIRTDGCYLGGWIANAVDAEYDTAKETVQTLTDALGQAPIAWLPCSEHATPLPQSERVDALFAGCR